ncbi:hypothetical protein EPUL_000435 [Erysiphe pulchra]|uniref:Uncharacterized protein n=1 Tax=Erysiphe pulchra TaxID=225359 RepID=A0A2S4PY00_9PEZI|nr:hypothetical protein EPUL_000435 [Erysiphe pulchra]
MYKRDIEKQEAEFIRDYIRKAIARLAALDNSPNPPLILMNTKPREREYQAVARAKAAEQRATAVTESIAILSSQSSEPSSSDTQQTSIEALLGEQMRL